MADDEEWALLNDPQVLILWRKGRSAWNSRIAKTPEVVIDFFNTDFSLERSGGQGINFDAHWFGKGKVSFWEARFGDGDASFDDSQFGDGGVSFRGVQFGNGRVTFNRARFGAGEILFKDIQFGSGTVSFEMVQFGAGPISFRAGQFGDGQLSFNYAEFGDKGVSFQDTKFGTGEVSFEGARLQGNLTIAPLESRKTIWSFRDCSFGGRTEFLLESGAEAVTQFDLRGARFDSSLTLRGAFGSVPDFRRSKVTHHVDLSEFSVTLRRKPKWKWLPWLSKVAEDKEDGARLRRLKEIAEGAKDHQKALEFAADENRANRWIKTGKLASVLDLAFSGFSNYGQSIMRPVLWLVSVFGLATLLFAIAATAPLQPDGTVDWWQRIDQSSKLALSNSVPFLQQIRELGSLPRKALFGPDPGWRFIAIAGLHGFISFVFLFLIGLGLRNRFRL